MSFRLFTAAKVKATAAHPHDIDTRYFQSQRKFPSDLMNLHGTSCSLHILFSLQSSNALKLTLDTTNPSTNPITTLITIHSSNMLFSLMQVKVRNERWEVIGRALTTGIKCLIATAYHQYERVHGFPTRFRQPSYCE